MITILTRPTVLIRLLPLALLLLVLAGCNEPEPPSLISIEPEKGSEGQLVVMQGNNLEDIRELLFNDELVPFNTAYNSDVALLFRIPQDISLGQKTVTVRTDGGSFTTEFLVTREAPRVFRFFPRSADPGETITVIGENFYDPPLDVFFRTDGIADNGEQDSIPGEIVFAALDSLIVRVPEGARTGMLAVTANGGTAYTNVNFETITRTLVTDFDGNGVRSDNSALTFDGFTDQQNGATYIRQSLPAPIDGQYLHISGQDELGTRWLGGPKTPSGLDSFGIETNVNNTFLEMDVNNNGRNDTWLTLVLQEQGENAGVDYTVRRQITTPGWQRLSIPLVRFRNSSGFVIMPGRVNQIKWHIEDRDETGNRIEMNIDNVEFVERF